MNIKTNVIALTDIGKVRSENQDAFLFDQNKGVFIVADGMGGMEKGKETAEFVVQRIMEQIKNNLPTFDKQEPKKSLSVIKEQIAELSKEIGVKNDDISGSTLVTAIICENKLLITNVGDSPAFLLREGKWNCLTKSHNVAGMLVEQGKITKEEAQTHPLRHRLVSFMGQQSGILIHTEEIKLKQGDRILLCTDGLIGAIEDNEIIDILKTDMPLAKIGDELIKKANAAGGSDNITLLLIDIL